MSLLIFMYMLILAKFLDRLAFNFFNIDILGLKIPSDLGRWHKCAMIIFLNEPWSLTDIGDQWSNHGGSSPLIPCNIISRFS